MRSKVRVGILGVSWWTDVVWPGFARAAHSEVTMVTARNPEKAERFATEHGIPNWTTDYGAAIESKEVDAVFIAVPNFLHHEMAVHALTSGKHVLQEKPMALSVEQAEEQARMASERGLVLAVDQESRLAPGISDLPKVIAERIGPLRKALVGMTMSGGPWGGWRGDAAKSGGSLLEMAIHHLDLARWLWGRNPVAITAMGGEVPGEDLTVLLDFAQGDSAIVDYCWRSIGFRLRVEAYGARGYLFEEAAIPFGEMHRCIVTESGEEGSVIPGGLQGPETFRQLLEGFAEAILTGAAPPITAEDGVWAVRMAAAAQHSLRTERRIVF